MIEARRKWTWPESAAVVLTAIGAAALLYLSFVAMCEWARGVFARSLLASCLLAVVELALFAIAVVLAPSVSLLLAKALGALVRRR